MGKHDDVPGWREWETDYNAQSRGEKSERAGDRLGRGREANTMHHWSGMNEGGVN